MNQSSSVPLVSLVFDVRRA